MSYIPNGNEYTITNSVSAGWPTVVAGYLRANVTAFEPNVLIRVSTILLDIDGNIIRGTNAEQIVDISNRDDLNTILTDIIQTLVQPLDLEVTNDPAVESYAKVRSDTAKSLDIGGANAIVQP